MARILIAEDERDIRELIEFTLSAFAGHTVFKAANGVEAVEMAPQVMPDLIMLDVRMPRMTGYEACKEIKKIDKVKDIPIVFLSAKGQESEIDDGLVAGAYDYILKPFAPDQLAKRVTEILAKFKNAPAPAPGTVGADPTSPAPTGMENPAEPPAPSSPQN
ncbi:MAG TPA: response regulator [Aggregatilineales bacterium]|nr:response regulator [Aggregatilineales bacterium]